MNDTLKFWITVIVVICLLCWGGYELWQWVEFNWAWWSTWTLTWWQMIVFYIVSHLFGAALNDGSSRQGNY